MADRAVVTGFRAEPIPGGSDPQFIFDVVYLKEGGGATPSSVTVTFGWLLGTVVTLLADLRAALIADASDHGYTIAGSDIMVFDILKGL